MAKQTFDDKNFVQELEKARSSAALAKATEPRAIAAYYDASNQLITIRLKSGATFSFPPDIAQGLAGASAQELAEVEITPFGDALHWEKLDADFSISGLLMGVFGSKSWMAELHQRWMQEQA